MLNGAGRVLDGVDTPEGEGETDGQAKVDGPAAAEGKYDPAMDGRLEATPSDGVRYSLGTVYALCPPSETTEGGASPAGSGGGVGGHSGL